MDFGVAYTQEQQDFRGEVRAWLDENVPDNMRVPADIRNYTPEMHEFWKAKHKELGKKGWLYPTYPKEYGGGGLSADHRAVIEEEMAQARAMGPISSTFTMDVLTVWGTEEQKEKFLRPLLQGDITDHMRMTEPHSGADLADYRGRAVRDGDDWILTGENVFISAHGDEDLLPGPMLTDPNAPRHRNLGYFIVPNPSPGLEVRKMNLLVGDRQKNVIMDGVRVPGDHLVGGDHQGWQVHGTHLEAEHGGGGRAFPRDQLVDQLVRWVHETKRYGDSLGDDPIVQQATMDAYLEAHVDGVLGMRAYWRYQSGLGNTYEGNVHNVHGRVSGLRNAVRAREIMGMYAYLDTYDPLAPNDGAQEVAQRAAAGQRHAGGSTNIAKVILARRMGISRTKEQAAPTPATMRSGSS